jgi:hypothetical protein
MPRMASCCNREAGVARATEEPVSYRVVCRRVCRAQSSCLQIYVAVLRSCSSQDDLDGRGRHGQRRDRRALGHPARGGEPVAPALLQGANGGPRRESPPGTPPGLSPQSSRLRSGRSHASGRRHWVCRCRDSASPTWRDMRNGRAWWPASATARCGVGCTRTRFDHGSTAGASAGRGGVGDGCTRRWGCSTATGSSGAVRRKHSQLDGPHNP